MVVATAMHIVAFNTKSGPSTVNIRAIANNNPRLYRMHRYKFINLFDQQQQQLSTNLRELTQCLPVVGVGYMDGIDIKHFDIFEHLEQALEHVEQLEAIPDLDNFPEDCTFDTDLPDYTESAKKKLRFDASDDPASKQSSLPTTNTSNPDNTSAVPSTPDNSNDDEQDSKDVRYIPNRDILNLSMDEDDNDLTQTSTTAPPEEHPSRPSTPSSTGTEKDTLTDNDLNDNESHKDAQQDTENDDESDNNEENETKDELNKDNEDDNN